MARPSSTARAMAMLMFLNNATEMFKLSYRYRILAYFLCLFALFTASLVLLERQKEKKNRREALEVQLNGYADMVYNYMQDNKVDTLSSEEIAPLATILPHHIRLSIIDNHGEVRYDNDANSLTGLENHASRPEVRAALLGQKGWDIRQSSSLNKPYFYFAKHYPSYFVRLAMPFNDETKSLLQADNYFVYIAMVLFLLIVASIYYLSARLGRSIKQLRRLARSVRDGQPLNPAPIFPNDELGDIAQELTTLLNQKTKAQNDLEREQEKLISHFKYAEEGIAFFNGDMQKIYANTHFYQFLNFIVERATFEVNELLKEPTLVPIASLLLEPQRSGNFVATQIDKNGKTLLVKAIVFDDDTKEIVISDITKKEKTRVLKQQMTGNIAHELRTPVACLRAYLETLHEKADALTPDKQQDFVNKAFQQAIRLSELIEDISFLSKLDENNQTAFERSDIDLTSLLNNLRIDFTDRLSEKSINLKLPTEPIVVKGHYGLLYTAFSNLMDNAIKYGGNGIEIGVDNYMNDDKNTYISFYDTGCGVPDEHLKRLFERFYRVADGRTRNSGGSGLGLSIVLHTIMHHQGGIEVRNRAQGGLEYLIRLPQIA